MAPGDLNLKKSWHPGLMKNREKVWIREQEALAELKKIKEREKEIAEERERMELLALQGKDKTDRIDWMYDEGEKSFSTQEANEEYLLGKKRIDELVLKKGNDAKSAVKGRMDNIVEGVIGSNTPTLSARDIERIQKDDPMFLIKQRQEQMLAQMAQSKRQKTSTKIKKERRSKHEDRDERRSKHHRNEDSKYVKSETNRERYERDPGDRERRDYKRFRSAHDHPSDEERNNYDRRYRSRSPDRKRYYEISRRNELDGEGRTRTRKETNMGSEGQSNRNKTSTLTAQEREARLAAMQQYAQEQTRKRENERREQEAKDAEERERDERMRSETYHKYEGRNGALRSIGRNMLK